MADSRTPPFLAGGDYFVASSDRNFMLINHIKNILFIIIINFMYSILGLWLRLECSLDSLSIDSAHVIYVSEGYDVAYNRRTASQPSYVVLRVTWYVKTFRNVNYVC